MKRKKKTTTCRNIAHNQGVVCWDIFKLVIVVVAALFLYAIVEFPNCPSVLLGTSFFLLPSHCCFCFYHDIELMLIMTMADFKAIMTHSAGRDWCQWLSSYVCHHCHKVMLSLLESPPLVCVAWMAWSPYINHYFDEFIVVHVVFYCLSNSLTWQKKKRGKTDMTVACYFHLPTKISAFGCLYKTKNCNAYEQYKSKRRRRFFV